MPKPVVYLIDDDSAVRDSLSMLIRSIGLDVVTCERPQEFFDQYRMGRAGCMLLDIRMPGVSGLTFQCTLKDRGLNLPIIFITGHGDVAQCSRAFRAGAVDFLTKPIDELQLIESVQKAISSSIAAHRQRELADDVQKRLGLLTQRELEVLRLMVEGLSNKMIALQLDVGVRTVESHRAKVFEKLGAQSLAQCVRVYFAASAGQISFT